MPQVLVTAEVQHCWCLGHSVLKKPASWRQRKDGQAAATEWMNASRKSSKRISIKKQEAPMLLYPGCSGRLDDKYTFLYRTQATPRTGSRPGDLCEHYPLAYPV